MWWRNLSVRKILGRAALATLAAQGVTLGALAIVDHNRKRNRRPVIFPRLPPRTVTAGGSEVTVYTYGQDLYADMLAAIEGATEQIFFETFIWKGDEIGREFKEALIAAADRGVRVHVVYDHFANLVVKPSFFDFGDQIHVKRHPLVAGGWRFLNPRYSGRNHRKLVIIDHAAAYVGGYNIGSLYATDWRDTHARLTGDIVGEMENAFIDYWNMQPSKTLWANESKATPLLPEPPNRTWVPNFRVHRNIPRHLVYPIRGMYLEAMDRAKDHIYLTHAYLVPDNDFLNALLAAAKRGVEVRIIVPAESNHIVADWISRGFYKTLLRGGVRLFLYQGAMVHAKTATIDGQWSTIGTANIDRLSLTGNYEVNVEIIDDKVARELEEIFAVDSSNTIEMTLEKWQSRHLVVKASELVLTPYRSLV